jgi:hypothetical protein
VSVLCDVRLRPQTIECVPIFTRLLRRPIKWFLFKLFLSVLMGDARTSTSTIRFVFSSSLVPSRTGDQ